MIVTLLEGHRLPESTLFGTKPCGGAIYYNNELKFGVNVQKKDFTQEMSPILMENATFIIMKLASLNDERFHPIGYFMKV